MVYSSSGDKDVKGSSDCNRDSRVGGDNCCLESTDLMSDLLSNLYSELNIFLYKG